LKDKYPVGSKITGKVRNLTNFGAFIEVEEGIDGLIHISDMSWTQRINHPSEILKKGDQIEAIILDLDPDNEKLSLGLKQQEDDPWQIIPVKYPIGTDTRGRVVKITEFGAFVELEKNIEGLIHLSEFSRERIEKPSDVVAIGDEVKVRVIKIDSEDRKIGLSMRAFHEAQERESIESYNRLQDEAGSAQIGDAIKDKEALKKKIEGQTQ
jgi:small subunit ribosomal protein S1